MGLRRRADGKRVRGRRSVVLIGIFLVVAVVQGAIGIGSRAWWAWAVAGACVLLAVVVRVGEPVARRRAWWGAQDTATKVAVLGSACAVLAVVGGVVSWTADGLAVWERLGGSTPTPVPSSVAVAAPVSSSSAPVPFPPDEARVRLSDLELVDVGAAERGDHTVLLDIKLRNVGTKTSVLKRAVVHVLNWRSFGFCRTGSPLPVSSTYRLTLPAEPEEPRFEVAVDLSEALTPNEAGRIVLEAGLDSANLADAGLLFQAQVELLFDREGALLSEPVLLSLPGTLPTKAQWREFAERDAGCARANLADLDFMLALPGRRSQDLRLLTEEP